MLSQTQLHDSITFAENQILEREIISTALNYSDDTEVIEYFFEHLTEKDFCNNLHIAIFAALRSLHEAKQDKGIQSIISAIKAAQNEFTAVDVLNIYSIFTTTADFNVRVLKLKQYTIRRNAYDVMYRNAELLNKYPDPFDFIDTTIAQLSKVLPVVKNKTSETTATALLNVMDIAHEAESVKRSKFVTSGLRDLDEIIGGFEKGDYVIIAARPSHGKTALAQNIIKNKISEGVHVGYVHLEMTRTGILQRFLSQEADVSLASIRFETLTTIEQEKLQQAARTFGRYENLHTESMAGCTVYDIARQFREWKRDFNIQIGVIDYLGLIKTAPNDKNQAHERELTIISAEVQRIAKENNIPILALHQMNRAVDARASGVAMLSDLRGSGSLEQDADTVLFIQRPEMYKDRQHDTIQSKRYGDLPVQNHAVIDVAKQRQGAIGEAIVGFEGSRTKFFDLKLPEKTWNVQEYRSAF